MKKSGSLMVFLLLAYVAQAAYVVEVQNSGFALPGTGKLSNWTNVPGWSTDTTAGDSGVETDGSAPDGDGWRGYLASFDPAVWQVTGETIAPGRAYTLRVAMRSGSGASQATISLFAYSGGTRHVLDSFTRTGLGGSWVNAELTYIASAAYAGQSLGIMIENTGAGWAAIDNVRLSYEGALPSSEWVERVTDTDVVLHWRAAPPEVPSDPNIVLDPSLLVNPDIINQYVFMSNGSESDPNLFYLGATGDPGNTPDSRYPAAGTLSVEIGKTYRWVVVSAMTGYAQSFTPGVSTLHNVYPQNLIGPTWTFANILWTCEHPYADWYDVNGDCKIDFVDFAAFAAAWLESGI